MKKRRMGRGDRSATDREETKNKGKSDMCFVCVCFVCCVLCVCVFFSPKIFCFEGLFEGFILPRGDRVIQLDFLQIFSSQAF